MILPSPGAATRAYWEAARSGRLLLRRCPQCGQWRHPRETACCADAELEWHVASGQGTLISWTVVRLALNPAFAAQVPYTITLTRTTEGPHILSSLAGGGHALRCGMPMQIAFDTVTADVTLPRFTPATERPA